jgi:hypothetical protein
MQIHTFLVWRSKPTRATLTPIVNIFFDCDYTILSSDDKLRRGTREVFGRLVNDGHSLYLWSGEGERWPVVQEHRLESYLTGVYAKPLSNFGLGLKRLKIPVVPDFVIDDFRPIVRYFGGFLIPEFFIAVNDDDALYAVYEVIAELVAEGTSSHPRWFPAPSDTRRDAAGAN